MLIDSIDFEWGYLHYYDYENFIGFSALKKLINSPFNLPLHLRDDLKKRVNNDPMYHQLSLEEQAQYYSQFIESEQRTIKKVECWINYANCLSVFSYFESQLQALCRKIEDTFPSLSKIEEVKGKSDLIRFKNYLLKVFEANILTQEPLFNEINQQKIIRDCIAHHNGKIPNNKSIIQTSGLLIDQFRVINISIEYLNILIDGCVTYLDEILPIIDSRYAEIKY